MSPDLLIIGASTRAAAHSALRGGLHPICVDLFGDADLRSVAEVLTVADYPAGLPTIAERLPMCPWMYTGGLENHPRIVARISEARPLLGNGSDVIARIRDPWWLASQLLASDLPVLEVWPPGEASPPRDGRWLRKPLRGAGGRGICLWDAVARHAHDPTYFQRRAVGESYSALFLAGVSPSATGHTELLGVTRQLIGLSEVHAAPFAWCGSIAPALLDTKLTSTMWQIGERLAETSGLRGLFGCDFVVEDNVPRLTEVNPRYTAGMELLEFQKSISLVSRHMAICNDDPTISNGLRRVALEDTGSRSAKSECVDGKLVLFADRELVAGDARQHIADPRSVDRPVAADLPTPGQRISVGEPICTVFALAPTEEECLAQLHERAREFRTRHLREATM